MLSSRANRIAHLPDLPCVTIDMTDFDWILPTPQAPLGAQDCLDLRGSRRKPTQQSD